MFFVSMFDRTKEEQMIIEWLSHVFLLSIQIAAGAGLLYFLYSMYRDARQSFLK